MTNIKGVWLMLLVGFSLSAQIKGMVTDESGKPVSYVNIWVQGENNSTTSEENGVFTINTSGDKNLIFSALGFEKQTIKASESGKVILKETAFKLDEVVVAHRLETREIEIGKVENETFQAFDNGPRIDAKFFPYRAKYKKTRYIKQVTIHTDNAIENATIKLHFYSVNVDGSPGEDLLTKDYIVSLRKGVLKHKFNVTDFNLRIPKNGIFVGFEKLIIEKNKQERTVIDSNTNTTTVQKTYYPFVLYNYVERDFLYVFSGGKWNKQTNVGSPTGTGKIKGYEPAINLILTN
ncbi:carboxypeptidase-like regulatory domain-containing protein [Flavobacterium sp. XGLA_31]|uniref:carboxypeptidase-like regulatory domain-containing protein n=1 Tax=Flavobacterium sp. XGLA_31 TaxID=3447666 RepID=UPI003F35C3E4